MSWEETAVWTQIQLLLHVLVYDELWELVVAANISNLQQDESTQFSGPATCESWFSSNWAAWISADKTQKYNYKFKQTLNKKYLKEALKELNC